MRRVLKHISLMLFLWIMAASVASCSSSSEGNSIDDNVLMTVGDSVLTRDYVLAQMPVGVTGEDSVRLFDAVVRNWVIDMLLMDVASANIPDYSKIERMVNSYRRGLILGEYRRLLAENRTRQIPEDSIKAYYNRNRDRMKLLRPILKGIYIKVPDDAESINDVRRWLYSAAESDVDKLEKYGLKWAMQYDYFMDRWVDWQVISDEIPFRFPDADHFVANHVNFETTYGGSTYFLHISDYIPSGQMMPYDYASAIITDIILNDDRQHYDTELINYIYSNAKKSGKIKEGSYSLSSADGPGSPETKLSKNKK